MLFHKFGHIQPHQGVGCVKEVSGQTFYKLCLTHAGRTNEDKGHGTAFGRDAYTVSADGLCYRFYCLVLTHNMLFQPIRKTFDLLIFLGFNFACRNFRPQLNNSR